MWIREIVELIVNYRQYVKAGLEYYVCLYVCYTRPPKKYIYAMLRKVFAFLYTFFLLFAVDVHEIINLFLLTRFVEIFLLFLLLLFNILKQKKSWREKPAAIFDAERIERNEINILSKLYQHQSTHIASQFAASNIHKFTFIDCLFL